MDLAGVLPALRGEAWKYTSLERLARTPFRAAETGAADAFAPERLKGLLLGRIPGPRLVFVDGRYAAVLSSPGAAQPAEKAELKRLPSFLKGEDAHPLELLNAASPGDAALVRVAPGTAPSGSIHLYFISTAGQEPVASHPRVLILAGAGSRARIVETYVGAGRGASFTNAVTEIVAAEGASVEHVKLQLEREGAVHLGQLRIRQEKGSAVNSHLISEGAALARSEVHVHLAEPGASCALNGLLLASGGQHADALTVVDHAAPRCRSDQLYKAILHGPSRGVFFGRIRVRPGAEKTEARLSNRNLLLTEEAEADTRPQFQIDADDVICTHGATVGQLDSQALFYLRSRGISPEAARSLLTDAFAREVLDLIPAPEVHDPLSAVLCGWLTRSLGGGRP